MVKIIKLYIGHYFWKCGGWVARIGCFIRGYHLEGKSDIGNFCAQCGKSKVYCKKMISQKDYMNKWKI